MQAKSWRFPAWMAMAAGLVLPGASWAQGSDAAGGQAPKAKRSTVEWTSTLAAREACLASRPADRVYFEGDEVARGKAREAHDKARTHVFRALNVLKVPARGFSFSEYRTKDGVLPLDLAQPLRALHGAVSLAAANDGSLGFPLDAAAAKSAVEAVKAGTATLELSFELDGTLGAACSGSLATNVFVVSVVPAMLELKDGLGKTLAKVEGPAVDRHRDLLGGFSGTPVAGFGLASSTTTVDVAELGRRFVIGQPGLKACYDKRIAEDPTLRGTVVFLVEILADGKIDKLVATADEVQDDELRACAEEAVRKPNYLGVDGLPAKLQVPVEFKLVPKKK